MLTRRAPAGRPTSVDLEAGTAIATLTTGRPVRRSGLRPDGTFGAWHEILDMGGADLSRVPVSLLLDHQSRDSRAKIGVVQEAAVQGEVLVGVLRFSRRELAREMLEDAADLGAGISIGYDVARWQRDGADGEAPIFKAVGWQLLETSIVNVPADAAARIRAHEDNAMTIETTAPAPPANPVPAAPAGGRVTLTLPEQEQVERSRILDIQSAGRVLRLEPEAAALVEQGVAVDAARAALFRAAEERDRADRIAGNGARISQGTSYDDPEQRRTAMADALTARICRTAPPDHARPWAQASIIDLARDCLSMRGITPPRTPGEVWTRIGGLHTTSDFALLLADAQNKSLRQMYESAPSGVRQAARSTTARDFKDIHRLQSGEFPMPVRVNEHGEFTRGTMGESDETYRLATYGKIFGVSRQVIINDDLSVFSSLTAKMAAITSEFVAKELVALLEANPVMGDGTALFHVNHGNLRSAAAVDVAGLSAARTALRQQKGLDGDLFIRSDPRFIVVPASLETSAEQAVAAITADQPANTNPFAGRLVPVVEPRLADGVWYLAGDPAQVDGLEYAWLDGNEGPQTETRIGFDVDGVETKLRLDFGAGFIDWRGWQKTPTS